MPARRSKREANSLKKGCCRKGNLVQNSSDRLRQIATRERAMVL